MYTQLLADSSVTVDEIQHGYKGLVVSGLIIVSLIIIGIWWLKRNA
jgi:hypothetical protein